MGFRLKDGNRAGDPVPDSNVFTELLFCLADLTSQSSSDPSASGCPTAINQQSNSVMAGPETFQQRALAHSGNKWLKYHGLTSECHVCLLPVPIWEKFLTLPNFPDNSLGPRKETPGSRIIQARLNPGSTGCGSTYL